MQLISRHWIIVDAPENERESRGLVCGLAARLRGERGSLVTPGADRVTYRWRERAGIRLATNDVDALEERTRSERSGFAAFGLLAGGTMTK